MTVTEVLFKEEPEDDDPEPLRMEHFHLPLGIWMVGILISLLCFIAEIIKHRKTNVPLARLEDPSTVIPSTAESENPGEMDLNKWKAERLSDTEAAELDLAEENIEDIDETKV